MLNEAPSPFETPLYLAGLMWPVIGTFGGGLNSTAYLARMVFDECPAPDRITFADTGNERPETYAHVAAFSDWLVAEGYPAIAVVRKGGRVETLEQSLLRLRYLPSLSYGGRSCSQRFKIEPQDREINRWPVAKATWARGDKVIKLVGYDAGERKRLAKAKIEDDKYFIRFPLAEWDMDRAACQRAARRIGFPNVPKSSCFFCPAHGKDEIISMRTTHPDLLDRALEIERVAATKGYAYDKGVKGLGRWYSWQSVLDGAPVSSDSANRCMVCIDQ